MDLVRFADKNPKQPTFAFKFHMCSFTHLIKKNDMPDFGGEK